MANGQTATAGKRQKPRERIYDIEDSLLLQTCRTKRQHFLNNLAPFTAFDPTFNNTFANNWLSKIEEAEGFDTADMMATALAVQTQAALDAQTVGFEKADILEYYVERAFGKKKRIRKEFGFNARETVRASNIKTVLWLQVMKRVAEDYATELAAVNMPSSVLSDIEAAANALGAAEVQQEYFKRKIIRATGTRIALFNGLYEIYQLINSAAQSVFADDTERRKLFNLP